MEFNIKKIQKYPIAIIFALVLIAHTSYIFNDFTWLDHGDIEDGQAIVAITDYERIFFSPFANTNFYRPVVTIFHSIDNAIYDNWAPGFHITNIFLHLIASILVYIFAKKFFELTSTESTLAAIIFGIHPLSWLPVGAISYRPEILVALFTLAALIGYLEYYTKRTQKNLFLFCLSTLIALLSKETALFWIPALIILFHYKNSTDKKTFSKKILLALFTILILYGSFRIVAVPKLWNTENPQWSLTESIGTRILALGYRLTELPSPKIPALADTIVKTPITDWRVFATITTLLGLLLFAFSKRANISERKAVLFILITLLPALNIVPLPRLSSPHYSYFPAIGVGVFFALLLRRHYFFKFIIGAWIILAFYMTLLGGFQFSNDKTLFEPEVTQVPEFREGHYYLGNYYWKQGDLENAGREFTAAFPSDPNIISYVDIPSLIINMAGIERSYKNFDGARELLAQVRAIAAPRLQPIIAYNQALIEFETQNYPEVIKLLEPYRNSFTRPEPQQLLEKAKNKLNK